MKILFISSLPETNSGGPKHSVPRQVNSQARYDDVKWINISPWGVEDSDIPCEIIIDIRNCLIETKKFHPDLVIFEDFQYLAYIKIAFVLRQMKIPYIIVPRGSMTKAAQNHKRLKKTIANFLFFYRFSKKAVAIEYLTVQEKEASSEKWNKNSLIIPNGTDDRQVASKKYDSKEYRGVFIGRLNPYHKGLDQFIYACGNISSIVKEKKIQIDLYGPAERGVRNQLKKQIDEYGLSDNIHIYSEVNNDEKKKILSCADFFILTSRFEGMPMGLIEAFSYGLPVLATKETNMGDVIEANNAGFISVCDAKQIENNLLKMINCSISEMETMSKNAFSLSKKYNWINIAKNAHELYQELIGERKNE